MSANSGAQDSKRGGDIASVDHYRFIAGSSRVATIFTVNLT